MKFGWSGVLTSVVTLDNQVISRNMLQQFSELHNMIKFLNEQCETAEKQEN